MCESFEAFKYQQLLYAGLGTNGRQQEMEETFVLNKIFKYIYDNYETLYESLKAEQNNSKTQLIDLLKTLHHGLKLAVQAAVDTDVGILICHLFKQYPGKEEIALFLLYQTLNTLCRRDNAEGVRIGDEVFDELIELLLKQFDPAIGKQRDISANIVLCFKLYIQKFGSEVLVNKLWHLIEQELEELPVNKPVTKTLLPSLFEEFALYRNGFQAGKKFMRFTEQLLKSEIREERKTGSFLLKMAMNLTVHQWKDTVNKDWYYDTAEEFLNFWSTYTTILDNLEENQSHLILPSLEQLKTLNAERVERKKWMQLLYGQILEHKNRLVRRWIIEHLMQDAPRFVSADDNLSTLELLLNACNCSSLYNLEGYFFSKEIAENFLKHIGYQRFLAVMAKVHWKAVPLHFWMGVLKMNQGRKSEIVPVDVICDLLAKIQVLQNVDIRCSLIKLVQEFFSTSICSLDLKHFISFHERVFNPGDCFNLDEQFFEILKATPNISCDLQVGRHFYGLLTRSYCRRSDYNRHNEYLRILDKVPSRCHSWLRFFVLDTFIVGCSAPKAIDSGSICSFAKKHYDLDLESLRSACLEIVQEEFINKLSWHDDDEKFVLQKAADIYVCFYKLRWDAEESFKPDLRSDILNSCTDSSKRIIVNLISRSPPNVETDGLLVNIAEHLKGLEFDREILLGVLNCFNERADAYWTKQLKPTLMKQGILLERYADRLNLQELLDAVIYGDAKLGDARIEDLYVCKYIRSFEINFEFRLVCLKYVNKVNDKWRRWPFALNWLIEQNYFLSKRKPRYFLNSKEHRLKLRIAIATESITNHMLSKKHEEAFRRLIFDSLWKILMEENNQLDICIIYERLSAAVALNLEMILEKIQEMGQNRRSQTKQEASMIAVIYQYAIKHQKQLKANEIMAMVEILLPMTMGANLQTRLYAQLALYGISNFEICSLEQKLALVFDLVKKSIEAAIGKEKISELMNDIHFFHYGGGKLKFLDELAYITDMPYDEWGIFSFDRRYDYLNKAREMFRKKLPVILAKEQRPANEDAAGDNNILSSIEAGANVQRKMNPTCEILKRANLIAYPPKDNEIYVIASLIDKVPNLGGLCRTCEVFGINNFVMNSKAYIQKEEFKNLSMTAEKSLNILEVKIQSLPEFLMQKKSEGFQVIGAEQTSKSLSFVDFKYPKKTVLLLGHEKEGIPPNLLGFLDFAIEIPQYGLVRSLNVHVTGALFMWEYCKQHIVSSQNT